VIDLRSAPEIGRAREEGVDARPQPGLVVDVDAVCVARRLVTGVVLPAELIRAAATRVLVLMMEGQRVQELVARRTPPRLRPLDVEPAQVERALVRAAADGLARRADVRVDAVGAQQREVARLVERNPDLGRVLLVAGRPPAEGAGLLVEAEVELDVARVGNLARRLRDVPVQLRVTAPEGDADSLAGLPPQEVFDDECLAAVGRRGRAREPTVAHFHRGDDVLRECFQDGVFVVGALPVLCVVRH
jgi:hypothetical protein